MTATLQSFLKEMQSAFQSAGLETPELDARVLMQGVLRFQPEDLVLKSGQALTEQQQVDLQKAMTARMARKPVARILGQRAFWKADFKVTDATLDPRPDSETLVEAALKHISPPPQTILDLGTGTGCLLLSLLQEWPQAKGVGIDISAEAVLTASENAQSLNLEKRARFLADRWGQYCPEQKFELVISNPPYISEIERKDLAPEVLKYDPPQALFGGQDGLECYREIVASLPRLLKSGGYVLFEIGHTQADPVSEILKNSILHIIDIMRDIGGRDRVIVAKKP